MPRPRAAWRPTNDSSWLQLINSEPGRYTTLFGSSGEFGLGDTYVRCRYRALDARIRTWSPPTGAVDGAGVVSRAGSSGAQSHQPFDQRIRDYMNYALNLDLSMIHRRHPTPGCPDEPGCVERLWTDSHLSNRAGTIPGLSIDSTLDPMGRSCGFAWRSCSPPAGSTTFTWCSATKPTPMP
jgi:hypothetical protein